MDLAGDVTAEQGTNVSQGPILTRWRSKLDRAATKKPASCLQLLGWKRRGVPPRKLPVNEQASCTVAGTCQLIQ